MIVTVRELDPDSWIATVDATHHMRNAPEGRGKNANEALGELAFQWPAHFGLIGMSRVKVIRLETGE